ncbi:MAG: SDR family oxidoreductase [Pseudomonadota bacterium]|nr:SDR family oxidoreductase [Pseudomonadota bacterium]
MAIVSGGLGAIGAATVRAMARHGADVAWCDIHPAERASNLLNEVQSGGRRGLYTRVDISDAASVAGWLLEVDRTLGTPTLIVLNAAVVDLTAWHDLTPELWRRVLSVDLDGAFYIASASARSMVEKRLTGRVVFLGSWAAEHVHLAIPTYCVAKAGLRMLSKCMAGALAPHGILVNEISPGFVAAGLADQFPETAGDRHEESRKLVPTGLMIAPDEVAAQIVQLCHPDNRHMTGSTLLMDGGLSLFGTSALRTGE